MLKRDGMKRCTRCGDKMQGKATHCDGCRVELDAWTKDQEAKYMRIPKGELTPRPRGTHRYQPVTM